MSTKVIEVTVKPNGGLRIEAAGFQGRDCEEATAFLEEALGVTGERERKPEYYRKVRRQQGIGR